MMAFPPIGNCRGSDFTEISSVLSTREVDQRAICFYVGKPLIFFTRLSESFKKHASQKLPSLKFVYRFENLSNLKPIGRLVKLPFELFAHCKHFKSMFLLITNQITMSHCLRMVTSLSEIDKP